jgi:hypothetical protein
MGASEDPNLSKGRGQGNERMEKSPAFTEPEISSLL